MRSRDSFDAKCSLLAVVADAAAIFGGFLLAVWIRFDSGWLEVPRGHPPRGMYVYAALVVTILMLLIFRALNLYQRPQYGHFVDKIPRIVRATGLGMLLAMALAFVIQIDPPFSRLATAIGFVTVTLLVVLERNILFASERHWAKYQAAKRRVILLGAGPTAAKLRSKLEGEPRRRCRVVACIPVAGEEPDPALPRDLVRAGLADLPRLMEAGDIDAVVVTQPNAIPHEQLVEIILQCERSLADFLMVPDLFRMLTTRVDVQNVDDIPLIGVGKWPLDYFLNRVIKRAEDIVGAIVGLIVSAPILAVAAIAIKRESPGPVFYKQERCGEKGRVFTLYKLRTMRVDAEAQTGPVWASPDDPRRTRVGAFLRKYNLDELPQFWNVLKGDMSLVGPRPERPFFVEQFKDDISRYMWRHVHKPGMTGWAQVNGYRGQSDLRKRIELDLWYLENWSLALDFKILVRTFFSRENAY
ncbi:MAG: undecaprenyl-phosphate glucose phosphotransferase [Kiritimatiellae bacterium]|nr:undecaprenyl-phosphate glucose phosphotransferase [Kiritimatiellia bacterium]MDW8458917.1 undecaprenyl-phosphate glucose phosphotransferase [Verrucomicrobiota bacterium]